MRISPLEFTRRHHIDASPAEFRILIVLAGWADERGRIRGHTARDVAEYLGKSLSTVKKQMRQLLVDGRRLTRSGWTYTLVGYATHDVDVCLQSDCIADSELDAAVRRGDQVAEQRRKRDRERKRQARKGRQAAAGAPNAPPGPPGSREGPGEALSAL